MELHLFLRNNLIGSYTLFTNGQREVEGAGEGRGDKLKCLTTESYFLACLIFASEPFRCSTLM
jgi:hypothetical protein